MSYIFILISSFLVFAAIENPKSITYKSDWGKCPDKSGGDLSVVLAREFEKEMSLKKIKEKILEESLEEKYFLSFYRINYDPLKRVLKIELDCPSAIARVQFYKSNGEEHFPAILGDNGKLYDPGFENLLRIQKSLIKPLPRLVLPYEMMESVALKSLVLNFKKLPISYQDKLSEIILDKNKNLTFIFSFSRKPTSVFLGDYDWESKMEKLNRILSYSDKKNQFPSTVNLVNAKKVVVKFSDKI